MTARYISTPHIKPFSSHETGFMLSLPSITAAAVAPSFVAPSTTFDQLTMAGITVPSPLSTNTHASFFTGVFSPQMPVNSVPPLVRMKNRPAQNSSAPTSLFTHER